MRKKGAVPLFSSSSRAALIIVGIILGAAALSPVASASSPPVNVEVPTITGAPAVGAALSVNPGTWTGDPVPTYTYQWQRCVEGTVTAGIFATTGIAPNGIAIDAEDNVYTANNASQDVTKITPDGNSSILAPALTSPVGIVVDSSGNVFTANPGSYDVTRITPDGASSIFAQTGAGGAYALALDSEDNIYTANIGTNNVSKILNPSGSRSILGSTGAYPNSIAVDSAGNVYTANLFDDNVSKIAPDGTSSILASTGDGPYGLTLDSAGNVYTANSGDNTVTAIAPDGSSMTLGTTGTNPFSLVVDEAGYVYTANFSSANVTRISPDGESSVLAATGNQPLAIALDSSGRVYTANLASNNVTRITQSYDCEDIEGATTSSYTQTAADVGKRIGVSVSASNTAGSETAKATPNAPVPGAPSNTSPPAISGDPAAGQTLASTLGSWAAYPEPLFTYQWQRCEADGSACTDIDGATGDTYDQTSEDIGRKIRVAITAANDEGEATANSAQVGPVAGAPENTAPPTISGSPRVGSSLTADPGIWTGYPSPTYFYQWLACDSVGEDCVEIADATGRSFSLSSAETGKRIRVFVTASNLAGNAEAESAATSAIQPGSRPNLKTVLTIPRRTMAGKAFVVKARVTNEALPVPASSRSTAASGAANNVKTCIELPKAFKVVDSGGARVTGRALCWTRSSLPAGSTVVYRATVRAIGAAKGSGAFRVTVSGSNAAGTATKTGSARIRIIPARQPKPKTPTG